MNERCCFISEGTIEEMGGVVVIAFQAVKHGVFDYFGKYLRFSVYCSCNGSILCVYLGHEESSDSRV